MGSTAAADADAKQLTHPKNTSGSTSSKDSDDTVNVQDATAGLDCDSDELEALEDAAEIEQDEDDKEGQDELDRLIDEATAIYPPQRIAELINELKQVGLVHFMQTHVFGISVQRVQAMLLAMGVVLPRKLRLAKGTGESFHNDETTADNESQNGDILLPYLVTLLKTALARILRKRDRLAQYNTVDDVVELLQRSKNIMCLGGAGLSTSCGIPDFRSKDGLYAQLAQQDRYSNLTDPSDMFDKDFFLNDPTCFFSFAKSIFPSNFVPSASHRFIKLLEDKGKLLRHYTQNIDTLEDVAGIQRVLHCHGSFSRAACTTPSCTFNVPGSYIKDDIFAQRVPQCPSCAAKVEAKRAIEVKAGHKGNPSKSAASKKKKNKKEWDSDNSSDDANDGGQGGAAGLPGLGVLKPCITFFGEKVTDEFDRLLLADREKVDLLLVIGTSLKVAPVSELVTHIPHSTPVIVINRTPILHFAMDIQLLGDADVIVQHLCDRLDWQLPHPEPLINVVGELSAACEAVKNGDVDINDVQAAAERTVSEVSQPKQLHGMHIWLFPGADASELLEYLDETDDDETSGKDEEDDQGGDTYHDDVERQKHEGFMSRKRSASDLSNEKDKGIRHDNKKANVD